MRRWPKVARDNLACQRLPECNNFRRHPALGWAVPGCAGLSRLSKMRKEIRLNAFAMNCVAHQSPGLWTHPRDRTAEYNRLPYWTDLAKTLERGRFDGLFLADVLGVYDVFGGNPDAALRNAAQRSDAADPGDGRRYRASRFWRHLQPVLRAALYIRAADVDARSPDRRT